MKYRKYYLWVIYNMPRKPKASNKACVTKTQVKDMVRKELAAELEEKVAVIGVRNEPIDTPSIPSGNVGGSSNFVKIFPLISQGDGQYNKRQGNEIRLKHLDIKMLLQYVNGDSGTVTNYKDQTVGVRVMILRQKDNNDQNGFVADAQTDKLLENGEIVNPGPSSFSGTTLNLVQKINREQFSVRYDKVFYMNRARRFNDAANQLQFNRPPRPSIMSKRLTFGKRGLKLTFGNGNSESPTNFPYVMVIGYASTEDTAAPSDNLVEYTYTANASYTDA